MAYDDKGREVLDPTPVALPVGWKRPESLQELVQRMVREHVSRVAAAEGEESFDEADDFEVEDDLVEPPTAHELRELEGLARWNEQEQTKAIEEETVKRFSKRSSDPAKPDPASAAGSGSGTRVDSPEASRHSTNT